MKQIFISYICLMLVSLRLGSNNLKELRSLKTNRLKAINFYSLEKTLMLGKIEGKRRG